MAVSDQGQIPKLVIGTTMSVSGINLGDSSFRTFAANLVGSGLVTFNSERKFVGDLAESWETDDAQTWTVHIVKTLIYDAVLARDYPVMQGAFLVITITVITKNFMAEMLYGLVDPRVSESGSILFSN
jgi:hypothetical protein